MYFIYSYVCCFPYFSAPVRDKKDVKLCTVARFTIRGSWNCPSCRNEQRLSPTPICVYNSPLQLAIHLWHKDTPLAGNVQWGNVYNIPTKDIHVALFLTGMKFFQDF